MRRGLQEGLPAKTRSVAFARVSHLAPRVRPASHQLKPPLLSDEKRTSKRIKPFHALHSFHVLKADQTCVGTTPKRTLWRKLSVVQISITDERAQGFPESA